MAKNRHRKKADARRGALDVAGVNGVLLAAGFVAGGLGYVLLARGSTIAAPLLLVLGYVVLIPLGIIR